jgi:Rrf2 family nitric oxide-sensitive transcriptional repressor
MRLSLQTDYALRTLLYLASKGERATVAEVAEFYQISVPHVAKVVNQLARLGLARSVRGLGGGIEMSRRPETIRLGEVIALFEGNLHLLECVGREGVCVIEAFCPLKRVFARAEQIQMDYLNGITLADILPTAKQMQEERISLGGLTSSLDKGDVE